MKPLTLLLLGLAFSATAQRFTISGYIKDASTGENLIGATVIQVKNLVGTTANVHSYYSITLPTDSVALAYSFVGYQPVRVSFLLQKDTTININLVNAGQLEEVVVNATRAEELQEINRMSSINITAEQIKALPALLGEVDVLKVLQLMPGVKSSEGSTGLYVRGGGPDQNLMLLDGVPVYNASHLFGFFSVFNADAINRVELIKGGFPARYGGRLSSVIDINMKDGNMKELHGEGSVGIIAAKATVEGPIIKDKTSFLISARRTYIDLLARPIIKSVSNGATAGYYFYDVNSKINHIINQRNRIYLSVYSGDDKAYSRLENSFTIGDEEIGYENRFGLRWGNLITAFRWNHVLGPRLFANFNATYSKYRFTIFSEYKEDASANKQATHSFAEYVSGIRDWAARADFDFTPAPNHYIRFGGSAIWHQFSPGVFATTGESYGDTTLGARKIYANELAAYAEDDIRINNSLTVNVGAHASAFLVEGRWYTSLQPRISGRLLLGKNYALKSSYATMTQFIHLLTNAGLGLPTDLWVPSTSQIRPQQSSQVALGLARTYRSKFEVSVEGYWKTMSNLIEYRDGAAFVNFEDNWQDKVVTGGRGESYGAEVLLQKKTGAMTGWIGYTLSWANRQFDDLNFGKWYPYKYDRRHDVSVAMSHTWNDRMDFSMAWVYGTGNAITLPLAKYEGAIPPRPESFGSPGFVPGRFTNELYYYGDRNGSRMNAYHRLDLSFSFWKNKRWGQRKWTIGVYNAYSRRNPFYLDLGRTKEGKSTFVQYSLFPIIPSFTYSFKF